MGIVGLPVHEEKEEIMISANSALLKKLKWVLTHDALNDVSIPKDLRAELRDLRKLIPRSEKDAAKQEARRLKYRDAARDQYEDEGQIEIDDDAITSGLDESESGGDYVQAWVWVEKQ